MQIFSVHAELFHLVTYLSSNSPIKHLLINRSTVVMRQFDGLRVDIFTSSYEDAYPNVLWHCGGI